MYSEYYLLIPSLPEIYNRFSGRGGLCGRALAPCAEDPGSNLAIEHEKANIINPYTEIMFE